MSGDPAPAGDDSGQDNPEGGTSLWGQLRALFSRSPTLRENLTEALRVRSDETASFSDNERLILQNVLKLGDMRVDDVMVPRAAIEAVEAGETMATLIARFHLAGHSRLPIYEDNLDKIVGFVHIKDALQRLTSVMEAGVPGASPAVKILTPVLRQKINGKEMVRKVLFVPPSKPVGDLLQSMQATRVHMAVVVDEYGGTDGLVTIEDLLEAVVGDIEDEHDDDVALIRQLDDNSYVADARIELSELQAVLGSDFDPGAHAEDADTLGGLLFDLVDRVPVKGEVISRLGGFEFEIMNADPRRIRRVKIRRKRATRVRLPRPQGEPPAEAGG